MFFVSSCKTKETFFLFAIFIIIIISISRFFLPQVLCELILFNIVVK